MAARKLQGFGSPRVTHGAVSRKFPRHSSRDGIYDPSPGSRGEAKHDLGARTGRHAEHHQPHAKKPKHTSRQARCRASSNSAVRAPARIFLGPTATGRRAHRDFDPRRHMLAHRHLPLIATVVQVCREGTFTKAAQSRSLSEVTSATPCARWRKPSARVCSTHDAARGADADRPEGARRRGSDGVGGERSGEHHRCNSASIRDHRRPRAGSPRAELRAAPRSPASKRSTRGAAPRHALRYPPP
jgi:hypothetical protein